MLGLTEGNGNGVMLLSLETACLLQKRDSKGCSADARRHTEYNLARSHKIWNYLW